MKKILMTLFLMPLMALADTWTDPSTGIGWIYTIQGGGTVSLDSSFTHQATYTVGSLSLPLAIDGKSVTSIKGSAFSGYSRLTSVSIPASVRSIGYDAFSRCSGLREINISDLASWCGIYFLDEHANPLFYGGKLLLNGVEIVNLTIPDDVTSIGGYAFYNDAWLASVMIPESVTSIGRDAFKGCTGIRSASVPSAFTMSGVFPSSYADMTAVTIPAGATQVADNAFSGCSKVATVEIPQTVTRIGSRAFYGCGSLSSVSIPKSVVDIGEDAFRGCDGLGVGVVAADGWVICVNGSLVSAEVPVGTKRIVTGAFAGHTELTSITLPPSLEQIGDGCFSGCSGLDGVYISDLAAWCRVDFATPSANPLSCAGKLYLNGREIIYLDVPEGVEEIGNYAFYNCNRFMSVTVPPSVKRVGEDAFSGCSGLTAVIVSDLSAWCGIDFASALANPLCCAKKLCLNEIEIRDLVVPDGVERIGDYAFCNGENFASIKISSSVRSFGRGAFANCRGLTSVIIPDGVGELPNSLFEGCWGLKSVVIPNSVTNISSTAFMNCGNIVSVTMPGRFALKDVFPSSYANVRDVTVLDGEKVLSKGVFAGCSALTTVVISEGVTTLGEDLFYNLGNLKELTVPSTVTSIGGYALYGCTSLEVIHVSNDGDIDALKQMLYESGFDAEGVTFDHEVSPISPEQTSEVPSALVDEAQTHVDVARGEVAPYESAAAVYDGMLLGEDGAVRGTIQVKVAKMRSGTAKVTATVQMTGGMKKISLKNGVADEKGTVTGLMAAGGHELSIALGVNGLGGSFRRAGDGVTYLVDGARNLFTAKDDSSRAAAAAIEGKWIGAINVAGDGVGLTISIAKKGKVKVSGTVVGVKVSATSQLLVGKDCCCVPVVITKKASLAFNLWLMGNGSVTIRGIASSGTGDETSIPHLWAGKPNTLKEGARFRIEDETKRKLSDWFVLLYEEYLPNELMVAQNGAKWIVAAGAKAGKVVFVSGTTMIDTSKMGENPSGLKLTYKAKDGSFKGAFKVYAMDFSSKRTKVKPYTVNVTGVMVGERGYGTATIKNPFLSFPITIE